MATTCYYVNKGHHGIFSGHGSLLLGQRTVFIAEEACVSQAMGQRKSWLLMYKYDIMLMTWGNGLLYNIMLVSVGCYQHSVTTLSQQYRLEQAW